MTAGHIKRERCARRPRRPAALRTLLLLALAVLLLTAAGCSPRRVMIAEVARLVDAGQSAYEQDSNLYLLSQSFPAHIKLLEALWVSDPRNRELSVLIARLYGGYAFAVLETDAEALRLGQPPPIALGLDADALDRQMTRCFLDGADFAQKALAARHPDMSESLQTAAGASAFFDTLDKKDVPALFWYGFNLAGFIQHNLHSVSAMSRAHLVASAMQRVLALDPAYYHYSAHLVLFAYYASRPPMMGGNPELAQQHYMLYREAMPQPVRLRELFRARYLLVQEQRRDDFIRIMTELTAEVPPHAPLALLDSVAAARAAIYLHAVDRFFD